MTTFSAFGDSERALRRQIDSSLARALFDSRYARLLLDRPEVALGDHGCSPQQQRALRTMRAADLSDFARQVHSLFWLDADWAALPTAAGRPIAAAG